MAKKKKALPKAQFGRGVGWGDSFKHNTLPNNTSKKSRNTSVATRAAAAAAAKKAYLKVLKKLNK